MREAIEQLTNHQQQLDQDGIMVGVSRQAVDEVLASLAARDAEIARLREALDKVAINAEQAQALYDRNGPTWTSRETGIEYENTADHLAFANELAAFARAALSR